MLDLLLLLMTLALGALLSRVSLCAVAGMQQAVSVRNYAGLERLLIAASGAGISLLLLAGLRPDQVWLPRDAHFHLGIIGGGVLLGLGAMVNGGCYLGSVLYLGTGNLNFLLTLAGIGLGLRAAGRWAPLPSVATPSLGMAMGPLWLAGLALFVLIIAVLTYHRRIRGQWLALLAGLLAGLVYARRPGWSYGSTLESLARGRLGLAQWRGELSALTLFVGAIGAAVLAGQFRLQRPTPWRALRCLSGGLILGFGAALIPGGNDNLLLWAIPGLTLYGALAFGLMLGAIGLGFWARKTKAAPATAGPLTPAQ